MGYHCFNPWSPEVELWVFRWQVSPPLPPLLLPPLPHLQTGEGEGEGGIHPTPTTVLCTVLYCNVLYCTVLYCTVLYCTVLYCTVLYCKK